MTQKTKFILTYVAGIVTGIVLLFIVSFCINSFNNSKGSDGVVMFESPGDVVPARTLRVIQVLEENCALAMVDDIESDNIGVIVLLRGGENITTPSLPLELLNEFMQKETMKSKTIPVTIPAT